MELKCVFSIQSDSNIYTCLVNSASITEPKTTIKSIQGTHVEGKSNVDVKKICFQNFVQDDSKGNIIKHFPRGLHNIFPNLTCLIIYNCGLKTISRADLIGLENLKELYIDKNQLTLLPNDLFQGMHYLMRVSFDGNRLKRLSSKLLKPLLSNQMVYVGFEHNTKINSYYSAQGRGSTNSLEELMDIIDRDCESPVPRHEKTINSGIQELWTTERLSDFTIVVEEEKFNVHKSILAIQSSVFMAMFNNDNEETREGKMIIKDFNSEVVEEFLCYFYTGEIPDATNSMDLFAIAVKYDVPGLKDVCEEMVLENLNVSNAFEVLVLGNLYGSDKMKELAFIELKKMFPGKIIPDKMMNKPERLKKLVDAQREVEQLLAEMVIEN